jgi:tetratricopeptide (TPR) repeat protein
MKKLKADALAQQTAATQQAERERQFGVTTNRAWAAYRAGNLTNAIAEADKALAIHEDDAGMKKLKADALAQQTAAAQQAERERQFGVATNAGWAAYRAGNLTNAIAEADKALAIHGDDAGMKKLKADALTQQTAAAQQAERERQFGVATNAGWAAYRAGNLTNAIAEADKALAIHGDNAEMKKLKADAGVRLTLAKENEHQPGTPPPANNVPGPKQPELTKLDTTLETYEVLFRLKPPVPTIVDKNGTQLKPLPLTLIPLDQKDDILKTLKGLESGYQAGGWLQEREQRLQNLRGKIKNW